MKLVAINWNPSDRQLRQFGVMCLVVLPLLGWLWTATSTTLAVLTAVGLVIAATSLWAPQATKPLFFGVIHRRDSHRDGGR